MANSWILFKIQCYQYFRINNWFHSKDNRSRATILSISLAMFVVALFLLFYNAFTALTLIKMGQENLVLSYMTSIASFVSFFFSFFQANDLLFFSKDTERLTSLPLRQQSILLSKLLFLYLYHLVIFLLFLAPGLIIWVFNGGLILSFLFYSISIFILPILPIILGAILAFSTLKVSAYFKRNPLFPVLLSLILIAVLFLWILGNMNTNLSNNNVGTILAKQITAIFPFAFIFETNMGQVHFLYLALYNISSLLVCLIFVELLSTRKTASIHRTIQLTNSKNQHFSTPRSVFSALFLKEWHRYRSSYILMMNTCLGVLLLLIYSLVLLLFSPHQIEELLGLTDASLYITRLAPFLIATLLSTSITSSSSLSLEGKEIWIIRTLPLSTKQIIQSKIFFNLVLHAIGYIPAILIVAIKYPMTIDKLIFLVLIPVTYSLFIASSGLYLNSKYPNYHWENESVVIKQSLPALISGLINLLASLLPVSLSLFSQLNISLIYLLSLVLLTLLIIIYYRKLSNINYI